MLITELFYFDGVLDEYIYWDKKYKLLYKGFVKC